MNKQLPKRVADKVCSLLQELEAGTHWSQIGGFKMNHTSLRVVFKLPSFYRLVCWYQGDSLCRAETMTHERYNSIVRNTYR